VDLAGHLAGAAPDEVAWAAWFVRRDRLRALVPGVRAALARFAGDDSLESQLARLQLLDALIQLDVRVPGEELLPHARGWLCVPALILAAKCLRQNFTYFQARMAAGDVRGDEWQVCGNLLAAQSAPGFAATCLGALELSLQVTVRDAKAPRVDARSVG
jgi:hypothetical protein